MRRVAYDRAAFDYGKLNVPANARPISAFPGFRLFGDRSGGRPAGRVRASSRARPSSARSPAARTSASIARGPDPEGRRSPRARSSRSSAPSGSSARAPAANALVDPRAARLRESTSGAVRMTFRPGDMTIVDVETTLFPRVTLEHVGLGGMALDLSLRRRTTAAASTTSARRSTNRPACRCYNGNGEWLWRPLQNPDTLQISAFVDHARRRASACSSATATTRPSRTTTSASSAARASGSSRSANGARAASSSSRSRPTPRSTTTSSPIGGPRPPMAAGAEVAFAYRQFWCWQPPERPPLATVTGDAGRARLERPPRGASSSTSPARR